MKYVDIKAICNSGDVFAVKGKGFAGAFIRALTGESYSHVAMLVFENNGLLVFEFVEGVGFQTMPASEWLRRRKGQRVCYCPAPPHVTSRVCDVVVAAKAYRNSSVISRWYGWLSLLKIWASQKTGFKIPVRQKVCSTFVQECWASSGFKLPTTATPGDIVNHCDPIHKITKGKEF